MGKRRHGLHLDEEARGETVVESLVREHMRANLKITLWISGATMVVILAGITLVSVSVLLHKIL
jgi:hypothetical protein